MAKTLEYQLVTGTLGAISQLESQGYRLQTGRELQDDRCQDGQESLQNKSFYAADGNVFYQDPKNGALSWAYTDGENNLITQPNYLGALAELPKTNIFRPETAQESWDAIDHKSSQRFKLTDLGLVKHSDTFSFIPIVTSDYIHLSPVQTKAAEAVGFTERNVGYLGRKGIKQTKIWLPNPNYLACVFNETGNTPIWLASWLDYFGFNSDFAAIIRYVNNHGALRGFRQVIAAGAKKTEVVPSETVLKRQFNPGLDAVLACLDNDIDPSVRPTVEARIRKLYAL